MLRTFDIILIAMMIAAAAVTYTIKHGAEKQLADIRRLEQRINAEKDTLVLLRADWSLLTQPSRLQKLVDIYQGELNLSPVEARQFVSAQELPARPAAVAPDPMDPSTNIADLIAGKDPVKTGSVKTAGVKTASHVEKSRGVVIPGTRPVRAGQ